MTIRAPRALGGVLIAGALGFYAAAAQCAQQAPAPGGAQPSVPAQGTPTPAAPVAPPVGAPARGNVPGAGNGTASGSVPQAGTTQSVFDLGQTIEAALRGSAALEIAARNVEIDRRRADEAAAQARPNINGDASATRLDAATRIRIAPDSPPVTFAREHNEILTLDLTQRLDFTGQIRAAANQARLQSLADTFDLQRLRNERILFAQDVYFNLLRAQHRVEVARTALAAAQAQQRTAQTLYENQVGQKIDVLRANTEVANAEQDVTRAENDMAVAQSRFNDLVGRPLDAPVGVVDAPGVTAGMAQGEVSELDINAGVESAYRQRPEILAAEVDVRVAETGVKLARAGQEPQFALRASGNYYPTTSFQFPRQRTAAITASVTLPLYDGGATRDRVQEARLRTENARTTLGSRRTGVALDVRQTALNLQTAARQIAAANTALTQATAARELAQVRYEGQVGLYLEVTDAQAALVRAQNNQINAVYDYLLARAAFENATGAPRLR